MTYYKCKQPRNSYSAMLKMTQMQLNINGSLINRVNDFIYLGTILTTKLDFRLSTPRRPKWSLHQTTYYVETPAPWLLHRVYSPTTIRHYQKIYCSPPFAQLHVGGYLEISRLPLSTVVPTQTASHQSSDGDGWYRQASTPNARDLTTYVVLCIDHTSLFVGIISVILRKASK